MGSSYRSTAVTLQWHGTNGTVLEVECCGRDAFGGDFSQTVNDGDVIKVGVQVGWAWIEIRWAGGRKGMNLDCYGKVTKTF